MCDIYDYWDSEERATICNSIDSKTGEYNYLGVICGYDESIAYLYAWYFDRNFISLGSLEPPVTTTTTTTTTKPVTTTTQPVTPITETKTLGDVDGNGTVDASDASNVLAVYAAVQTGNKSALTSEIKKIADVDGNGIVDASDASTILAFYAYRQTGGNKSFADFIKG